MQMDLQWIFSLKEQLLEEQLENVIKNKLGFSLASQITRNKNKNIHTTKHKTNIILVDREENKMIIFKSQNKVFDDQSKKFIPNIWTHF